MARQFHIKAPGCDLIVIDLKENEAVDVRIYNPPRVFGRQEAPTTFKVGGLRWTDTEHFHLSWAEGEMLPNESFTVELVDGAEHADSDECEEHEERPTPLEKDEVYVPPEMACRFCERKKSEVRYLVDWSFMASICDQCVEACQRLIDERKASDNPDKLIIGSNKAQSLIPIPKSKKH